MTTAGVPRLDDQREFWNGWNAAYRGSPKLDRFTERQRDTAVGCARLLGLAQCEILEVGCGTGWLSNALKDFGRVTGVDLSPEAIAQARERYPGLRFIATDFDDFTADRPFDFVISADVIAHVADQRDFIERVARLLRPGGALLLMTQNPEVWRRVSYLKPQGGGQIRNWPSLAKLHELVSPYFRVEQVSSIEPGGNRGRLFWVENRITRRVLGVAFGELRWRSMLEAGLFGRELVLLARRH
jgi:2-polyprenyl-3-methyl-5-hydroxy-6-metoxy-1,4-benzoquinol methylase